MPAPRVALSQMFTISFMPLQITYEENGAQEIIPTCPLAVYLDGEKVSLEPYEFKAPKITVVYKDDLSNLRPPKK